MPDSVSYFMLYGWGAEQRMGDREKRDFRWKHFSFIRVKVSTFSPQSMCTLVLALFKFAKLNKFERVKGLISDAFLLLYVSTTFSYSIFKILFVNVPYEYQADKCSAHPLSYDSGFQPQKLFPSRPTGRMNQKNGAQLLQYTKRFWNWRTLHQKASFIIFCV